MPQHIYIFPFFLFLSTQCLNRIEYLEFLSNHQKHKVNPIIFFINQEFEFYFFLAAQYNCLIDQNINSSPNSNCRYYFHFALSQNFIFVSNLETPKNSFFHFLQIFDSIIFIFILNHRYS